MSVYAIAQLAIKDREAYKRYQSRFMDVFSRFAGELLVADENPTIVEGHWDRDKVVLIRFPDEACFRRWAESPEYQEIAVDRKQGADTVVLLVREISV